MSRNRRNTYRRPNYRGPRPPKTSFNGSGIGGIIAIIIVMSLFGGGISLGFGLLALLFEFLPLIIFGVVIYNVIKNLKGNKSNRNTYSTTSTTKTNSLGKTFLSNAQKAKIDNKLKKHFKNNYRLTIFEDIALVTQSGTYTSYEDLYIAKGDEMIIGIEEFGNRYPSVYNEVIDLLDRYADQKDNETKETYKPSEEVLSEAEKYINRINNLNIGITNEEIKSGLNQTCTLLKQIDTAAVKGEDDNKIDKLYDYYLPILMKILDNYKSLSSGTDSEEFKKCENQLIKTIVLINEALKTINESIREEDYMDLSADITTLQSLLKKDGLVKSGTIYEGVDDDKK